MAKDNWDILKNDAISVISQYIKGDGEADPELQRRVKVATSVLSSYTRHEQTESAREQNTLIIARTLSDNKEEFAKFMRFMPRFDSVKKALTQ